MKPIAKTPVKTYFNRRTNTQAASLPPKNAVDNVVLLQREPITTKKAVELLLEGTLRSRVCRYCLNVSFPLSELDQILKIGGRGAMYDISIRDMVATFHPFKVVDDPNFPNKICGKCLNQTIRSYLFAQQCEQSERALRNCFDDIYEKLEKLDPLERVHKRGRQKLNPNHNILYTDHEKVIDYAEPIRHLINSGSSLYTNEPAMSDLECKKCWQVLPNIESLANHEKVHPKTMWFNCRLCGTSYAKRAQLKKHLQNEHKMKNNLRLPESDDFECKECGFVTKNHLIHLQHIEKHKFQTVLEHLIQRKMDKLCTVCLDKGCKLSDLDKVISLHGGYPELTGDRTLYNILGSTIPENQLVKYQELIIPCKAKILTITKRSKKIEIQNEDDKSSMFFKLSCPGIISTDEIQDDDLYLFVFSEPRKVKDENENTDDGLMDIESGPQAACNQSYEENRECTVKESANQDETYLTEGNSDENETVENVPSNIGEGTTFSFSNPEYKIEVRDINIAQEKNEAPRRNVYDLCNTCYIFKKPICGKCNTLKVEKEVKTTGIQNTCNFCWVFKSSGKCDFCKNTFKADATTAVNVQTTDIDDTVKPEKVVEQFNTNEEIEVKNVIRVSDPCKFCWEFKNNGKCDLCKNALKANTSTATNEHTTDIDKNKINFVFEPTHLVETDKETNKFHLILKEPFKSRKRKLPCDYTKIEPKKTKWQCSICLVNNGTNRQTCICCESNVFNDDSIKIMFGLNKNCFFDAAKKTKDTYLTSLELQEYNRNDISDEVEEINSSVPESLKDQANIDDIKFESREAANFQNPLEVPKKIPEVVEIQNTILDSNDNMEDSANNPNMITPMKFKIVTNETDHMEDSANNLNMITPMKFNIVTNETMEIDEENNNHIKPAPTSSFSTPNPNITFNPIPQEIPPSKPNPVPIYTNISPIAKPTSFQFNVGSTPKEAKGKDSRKYLRAVKRR